MAWGDLPFIPHLLPFIRRAHPRRPRDIANIARDSGASNPVLPMPYTYAASKQGYANLWRAAEARAPSAAASVARGIIADRERYEAAAEAIGHPNIWSLIGAIHYRESSRSFNAHLHNGDSLKGYTHRVPAGRPKVGHGPPFTWEESAQDALKLKSWDSGAHWDELEYWLYKTEEYNGWGYLGKNNSPYLWSKTSKQQPGKYVRDHVYDPNAVDSQLGVVAILKAVFSYEPSAEPLSGVAPPEPEPPPMPPAPQLEVPPSQTDAMMRRVIDIVMPMIEREFVVLTKEQFEAIIQSKGV